MLNATPTVPPSGGEPLLYVAELLHRVSNEYASAISLASVMASRTSSPEARSALKTVIEHLVQLASAHRVLLPPVVDGTVDLGAYLARLCQAKAAAELSAAGHDPASCCRILRGRLTTRAAGASDLSSPSSSPMRRATACRQGAAKFVFRSPPTPPRSYAGSVTTARLPAAELDGHVERRFGGDGPTITLMFPARSHRNAHWQESSPLFAVGRRPT